MAENGGNGKGGIYALLVVIVILIVGAVLYFGIVRRDGGTKKIDVDINVSTPQKK